MQHVKTISYLKDKPVILVTGANGQLGKELKEIAPSYPSFHFLFLSREDLPIHHFELVRKYFEVTQPDYCINCAAYTAVDKAELEKELAFQVNSEAVGVLAAVCQKHHTKFFHISTDYVFDGTSTIPYSEDTPPNPLNSYGGSKLAGEQQAMKYNPDSIIIRTSWVYSAYGKNFVKTMLKLMQEKSEISVVNDQFGSPTYAGDLAQLILMIVEKSESDPSGFKPGIYHYCNDGVISWYNFAGAIKKITGSHCILNPVTTAQFPTTAKRPPYSVLNKEKIIRAYHPGIPYWEDSLKKCLEKLK